MAKKRHSNARAQRNRQHNLQQAEYRRQAAKEKAFWQAHGKKILIGTGAAVLAILVIWLGCKFFVGPGGSIPNFFGTLRNVESDWLVTNTGTTSKPKYFKMGEFTAPEGYTQDPEYTVSTDKLNQTFYFDADDQTAPVKSVYVAGVANKSAEDMINTVVGYGYAASATEAKTATIGGHDVHYAYLVYGNTDTATDTDLDGAPDYVDGYPSMTMYVDSVQGSCVLMLLNGHSAPLADVATEEAMLAEAEKLLPLLTVEK